MFFRVCISVFRRRGFFCARFFEAYCGSRKTVDDALVRFLVFAGVDVF